MILFKFINNNGDLVCENSNTEEPRFWVEAQKVWNNIQNEEIGKIIKAIKNNKKFNEYSAIRTSDKNDNILYFFVRDDADLTGRNKSFLQQVGLYKTYLSDVEFANMNIKNAFDDKIKTVLHNISDPQTRLQDEVESILKESELAECKTHQAQINIVKKLISGLDTGELANSLVEIRKALIDMRTQFTGIGILVKDEISELSIKKHNILKVLYRIIHPYYKDLEQKNIKFIIYENNEILNQSDFMFDFEIFQMGMAHFFNNMTKYVKESTEVHVSLDTNTSRISFSMDSVFIDPDEINKIYELKYFGIHSGNDKGEGIGMYIFKKSMDMQNISIITKPGDMYQGEKYARNVFELDLSRKKL